MAPAPSGKQFEISFGEQRATVVEVGGGIREYSAAGRQVLESYALDAICDGGHGAVLVPWPNRLGGGSYEFGGARHQLALSEPARGNAIHGLLRWSAWRAVAQEPARVVMSARVHPQPGYPFDLEVSVEYSLGENGLVVVTSATNLGAVALPFGAGHHPYLSPGGAALDDCTLRLAAGSLIEIDPTTGLPSGRSPIAGGELDFREERPIGPAVIDSPFDELERDGAGLASAALKAPDGSAVELWADDAYTVMQVFTGDTLSAPRRRTGLAVEPMSCPPDAFRSGQRLVRLEPEETWRGAWGARLAGLIRFRRSTWENARRAAAVVEVSPCPPPAHPMAL